MSGNDAFPAARRALLKGLAPFQPSRRSVAFAVRAVIASLVAFGAVLALGFKEIGWAPITVWVLALPRRGMILSKSFYRAFGTVIGAGVAFLLLPLEGQPWLFMLLMAAWVAACGFTSNLFRSYQAYAAQLAGFTAPIVAILVHGHVGSAPEIAFERVCCVLTGIAASALVTVLFSKRIQPRDAEEEVRALAAQGVRWAATVLEKTGAEAPAYNHGLLAKIADVNLFCENAAVESVGVRARLPAIRRLTSSVLSLVSTARAIERVPRLAKTGRRAAVIQALTETADIIERGGSCAVTLPCGEGELPADPDDAVPEQVVRDRLREMSGSLKRIASELEIIRDGPKSPQTRTRLPFHRDWQKAASAGVRTFFATGVTGALWLGVPWSGGAIAFIFCALASVVFGSYPLPTAGIRRFSQGVTLAALTFVLWKALPFSAHASFGTTLSVVVVLTFFGAIALANNLQQGMDFNANVSQLMLGSSRTLIGAGAAAAAGFDLLAGIAIAWLAFALSPNREARREQRLAVSILADIRRLAQGKWRPPPHKWEVTLYDRLYQSGLASAGSKAAAAGLRHCLFGLDMGLEILRLHDLAGHMELMPADHSAVDQALELLAVDPTPAKAAALSVIANEMMADSSAPAGIPKYQAAGAIRAISRCLERF